MHTPGYTYYNKLFKGLRLPLAWVDLDLFDKNVRDIAVRAGNKTIRIASKSLRSVALMQRILAADSRFRGIMSFTVEESLFLLEQGFDDILLGYPCVNEEQLTQLVAATASGKRIIPMVDCREHLVQLNSIASSMDVVQPVCIDIDMSMALPGLHFGVMRSPITNVDAFKKLVDTFPGFPHLRLEGVMGYEAQIAGLGEKDPSLGIKSNVIPLLKKLSIRELSVRRKACVEYARSRGHLLPLVNGGGTGSVESTREEDWVTEITVGSGFYSPVLFDHYAGFHHLPAAGYALEIIRIPRRGVYTCLGGGYIASGAVGVNKQPVPYLPEGAVLTENEGAGEVQTPVSYTGMEKLSIGDTILMRHSKAGELCERFNALHLVHDGKILETVPTYRGMGQCFL